MMLGMRQAGFPRMAGKMRGITLMEVMIVVVIIGLLAAIAYPNYRDFAARAKRNEAKALLLEIAQNQDRAYWQISRDGSPTELGYAADTFITETGSYQVTVNGANAANFDAQADYQLGGTEAGKCLTFNVDGRGSKTSAPLTDCWTRTR